MDWTTYQHEFTAAEGLRQIIVTNVTPKDWQKLFRFLVKTEVALTLFIDGVKAPLPSQLADIVQQNGHHYMLALKLDAVTLHCDFARQNDILLYFDPGQISDEAKATLLFRVMSTFGRRLRKVVVLTAVNHESQPVFRYVPGQGLTYIKLNKQLALYE